MESRELIKLNFLEPTFKESTVETYIELDIEGANARLHYAGQPVLPIYTETKSLPFATKIIDIKCEPNEIKTMDLSDIIIPAPQPMILGMDYDHPEYIKDETIYNSIYFIRSKDTQYGSHASEIEKITFVMENHIYENIKHYCQV